MKNLSKIFMLFAIGLALTVTFVSCGSKGTCDMCGQEKTVSEYNIAGVELKLCKACIDDAKHVENMFRTTSQCVLCKKEGEERTVVGEKGDSIKLVLCEKCFEYTPKDIAAKLLESTILSSDALDGYLTQLTGIKDAGEARRYIEDYKATDEYKDKFPVEETDDEAELEEDEDEDEEEYDEDLDLEEDDEEFVDEEEDDEEFDEELEEEDEDDEDFDEEEDDDWDEEDEEDDE